MDALMTGTWRESLAATAEAATLLFPALATALVFLLQVAPRLWIPAEERPPGRRFRQVIR